MKAALASLTLTLMITTTAVAENARYSDLANLQFQRNYPTDEAAQRLSDELLFRRGVVLTLGSATMLSTIASGASHRLGSCQIGSSSRRVVQ